jgi:hypothetical protein
MAQMRNDLGSRVFDRAQRAYFDQWSFRHPTTSDFFAAFEKSSGRDLSTYRRNLVEGTSLLDWQVVSAKSSRDDGDDGVFDRPTGRLTLEDDAIVRPEKDKTKKRGDDEKKIYGTVVVFGNTGQWQHGASARMVFEDGTVVDRTLPATASWVRFRIRYKSKLAWAAADPERKNPWDHDRLNDSKVLGSGKGEAHNLSKRASVKYSGWATYLVGVWTQLLWVLA